MVMRGTDCKGGAPPVRPSLARLLPGGFCGGFWVRKAVEERMERVAMWLGFFCATMHDLQWAGSNGRTIVC